MKKRRLVTPWPFLYSVTAQGLVENVQPKPAPLARRKRVPPSSKWTQEGLL